MTRYTGFSRSHMENIMRGQARPGIFHLPLAAAQTIYATGVSIKNRLYTNGWIKPHKASCKVISVGGLTLGGSGKTPMTIHIARLLMEKMKIGVLSRGYGQQANENILVVSDGAKLCPPPPYSADEPYMMAKTLPGVPVVTAGRRADGADLLVEKFGVEVVVLDDGFQHRALHRDIDIVLVDQHTLAPERRGLFPLGYLREPPSALARADVAVVMVRTAEEEQSKAAHTNTIQDLAGKDIPVILARGVINGFSTSNGSNVEKLSGPAMAFCGIANPESFKRSLQEQGIEIDTLESFPDHHVYTPHDVRHILGQVDKCGAKALITTEKDAVKLEGLANFPELAEKLYVAQWELEVSPDLEDFIQI